jgi:hypothetical protein
VGVCILATAASELLQKPLKFIFVEQHGIYGFENPTFIGGFHLFRGGGWVICGFIGQYGWVICGFTWHSGGGLLVVFLK